MSELINPCEHCDKADMHYVNDCEYGCDEPCEKARIFYKMAGDTLEDILKKINKLLEKTGVGEHE